MLSPARKKNIALLNLSQCIVFMEKCISVPHDRKKNFAFLLMRKNILTGEGSEKKFTSTMTIPDNKMVVA